jgi:hypothetical protein
LAALRASEVRDTFKLFQRPRRRRGGGRAAELDTRWTATQFELGFCVCRTKQKARGACVRSARVRLFNALRGIGPRRPDRRRGEEREWRPCLKDPRGARPITQARPRTALAAQSPRARCSSRLIAARSSSGAAATEKALAYSHAAGRTSRSAHAVGVRRSQREARVQPPSRDRGHSAATQLPGRASRASLPLGGRLPVVRAAAPRSARRAAPGAPRWVAGDAHDRLLPRRRPPRPRPPLTRRRLRRRRRPSPPAHTLSPPQTQQPCRKSRPSPSRSACR